MLMIIFIVVVNIFNNSIIELSKALHFCLGVRDGTIRRMKDLLGFIGCIWIKMGKAILYSALAGRSECLSNRLY